MSARVWIGLAGWTEAIGRFRSLYPLPSGVEKPTALQRYAESFDFAEINATFYRRMRRSTFERWADDTPPDFGFSVKMNRGLTHFHRLKDTSELPAFIESVAGLGEKWKALLVQLPPSLAYDAAVAQSFFAEVRRLHSGPIACEPRHASWTAADAVATLGGYGVGIVRTQIPRLDEPVGVGPAYVRLHGTPRRYYSAYSSEQIAQLAAWLRAHSTHPRFVVFDNTASSAATLNARELQERLDQTP